jgi:uncharacterized protein YfaS (alpha-2-macroglobulin family)
MITITVKDASNGALIRGASVDVDVINPSGSAVAHFHGNTGFSGTVQFTYHLGYSSARGIWKVSSTASLSGYQNGMGQTTFKVI